MGRDKALVEVGGTALWRRVVAAMSPVAEVRLVRRPDQAPLPWPTLTEVPGPGPAHHPLHGVVTALAAARGPVALIGAVDLPDLPPEAWRALWAAAPAVAASDGIVQPLIAAVPVSLLPLARALVADGAPARALLAGLPRVELPAAWVRDVDTPEAIGP